MRISDWSSDVCSSDLNNDADKLRWIVGAFYLNEKGNDEIRIIEPSRRLAIPESNTTNAFALFGQASYELIDRLRLTGGLRYSYEKKDFAYRVLLNGNQVDAGQPKSSWTAWTPKIGLRSEEHTSEHQSLMRNSYA